MYAGVPDEVAIRTVNQLGCVEQNENTSQYLLEWMPPDNIYIMVTSKGNATEMVQLGKCQSPVPDSSSVALKISASLWALLLIKQYYTP